MRFALLLLGLIAGCTAARPINGARPLSICDLFSASESKAIFEFQATYKSDGMTHSFFEGKCRGISTIKPGLRPHDSDGSFEIFLKARKQECERRMILAGCSIDADVEGSGRVVKSADGEVSLEVFSISRYRFEQPRP